MKSQSAILILLLSARVALGGVIVSEPGMAEAERFQPEGVTFGLDGSALGAPAEMETWERRIGKIASIGDVNVERNDSGRVDAVVLEFSSLRPARSLWTVDGLSTLSTDPDAFFAEIYLQLKVGPIRPPERISLPDLSQYMNKVISRIDGMDAIGEGAYRYLHVDDDDESLSDLDVMLSGTLNIDWSGASPTRTYASIYSSISQIPEPASIAMVILVSATGLFVRRRFR